MTKSTEELLKQFCLEENIGLGMEIDAAILAARKDQVERDCGALNGAQNIETGRFARRIQGRFVADFPAKEKSGAE